MPERILFVDDAPELQHVLRLLLQARWPGTEVLNAATGDEALQILAETSVDVVVSDYRMPGMDGLELLRRIRETHPGTSLVLSTAYQDTAVENAARGLGASFVHKTQDVEGWLAALQAAFVSAHRA